MLVVSFLMLTAGFAGDGIGGGGACFFGAVAGAGCFGGGLWEGVLASALVLESAVSHEEGAVVSLGAWLIS